jgi:hypothetical protein
MHSNAQKQIDEEWKQFQAVRHLCKLPANRLFYRVGNSQGEREPDIVFIDERNQQGFELTELCDTKLQRLKVRSKGSNEPVAFKREIKIVSRVLSGKFERGKYTDKFPIDLVCYWNFGALLSDEAAAQQITSFLETQENRPFRKIWFIGVLGKYEFTPDGRIIKNHGYDLHQLMGHPVLHFY